MNGEKRIVVDVSDLINWQGNLSGIQRVVAEMAYRYERSGAIFCYYLEGTQTFHPLDSFSDLMTSRSTPSPVSESRGRDTTLYYKAQLKRAARLVTPPVAIKVYEKTKHIIKSNTDTDNKQAMPPVFEFQENDTLLIFGAHWDKPHYVGNLKDMKERYGLRIGHVINDIIPIVDKAHVAEVEHVRFPKYIYSISKIADIIYVISKSTENDYRKFLKENNIIPPIIKVLTLGEDYTSHKAIKPAGIKAQESYILMVGTIEVRKNHALLYSVYKRAVEMGVDLPKLVIVGRQGWLSGDVYYQMVHDSMVSDKIIFMHSVSDRELSWLYEHCLFTVFPAFYEGWGLPVAEAARYGKVTAASNTSSIPEVVGDGAVYFSPYSTDECLKAIQELLDENVRRKYEEILRIRPKASWDEAYNQSLSVLE